MLLLRMRMMMRMRMRMKMVGKVNRKGEPTPFFCVLTYSDLQSKKYYDSKDGKQRGWGADRLQSRWLIGRPWDGILNNENIATPFSGVDIKPSGWNEWTGSCQCTATNTYALMQKVFHILILLISSIPIYDTLAHCSPP